MQDLIGNKSTRGTGRGVRRSRFFSSATSQNASEFAGAPVRDLKAGFERTDVRCDKTWSGLRWIKSGLMPILSTFLFMLVSGCENGSSRTATGPAQGNTHEHKPPHGGTAVVLGNEEYHLEVLLTGETGVLQIYVMDAEFEHFIRIAQEVLELNVKTPARQETLVLAAVANNATGERVGDTALFQATADWLKGVTNFTAVLSKLTVKGQVYENVAFKFPEGNEGERAGH
jgi:hypothetical protein